MDRDVGPFDRFLYQRQVVPPGDDHRIAHSLETIETLESLHEQWLADQVEKLLGTVGNGKRPKPGARSPGKDHRSHDSRHLSRVMPVPLALAELEPLNSIEGWRALKPPTSSVGDADRDVAAFGADVPNDADAARRLDEVVLVRRPTANKRGTNRPEKA